MLKEQKLLNAAAVASERAAEIYDMQILAKDIADNTENYTRFFVLSKEDSPVTGKDKTSIILLSQTRTRLALPCYGRIRQTRNQPNPNRIKTNETDGLGIQFLLGF